MRLAAIFSEHMILQRERETAVFGETEADARIRLEIDGISVEEAVSAGRFVVMLPAHPAGGPYTMKVFSAAPTGGDWMPVKEIGDVYYGEVWIDNGQSNIEFEIRNARGGVEELKKADFPLIRTFKSIKTPVIDDEVLKNEQYQEWKLCREGAFFEMSGVAWYFAKVLHKKLDCPIGIVDCYQGGSSISCWLSEERLSKYPEGRIYQEVFNKAIEGQTEEEFNRKLLEYNQRVAEYLERERIAKSRNPEITPEELSNEAGDYPWPPPQGLQSAFRPSGLYHTMLERIAPFTAKGIIYYQGEEDSGRASGYAVLLKELVDEFRTDFRDPALPIVILQLPMFIGRKTEDQRDWGYLREAQAKAVAETRGTLLIPLIDCGEFDNVHPVDKKTPGEHTAGEVLYSLYGDPDGLGEGDKGLGCHMELSRAEDKDQALVLHFNNTFGTVKTGENELLDRRQELDPEVTEEKRAMTDPHTVKLDPQHIYGFEVRLSGRDDWVVPTARIEGDTVILSADGTIEEVRYGFFNYGKVNLYNGYDYPLAPFCWKRK